MIGKYLNLLLFLCLSSLVSFCATPGSDSPEAPRLTVTESGDIENSEEEMDSLTSCLVSGVPEWFFGLGLAMVPGYALAPVFGFGYPIYKSYACYSARRSPEEYTVNVKPLINGVKKEAYSELSKVCSSIAADAEGEKTKIKEYADLAKAQLQSIGEARIAEMLATCATGKATLDELKLQIRKIQKGKFEIIEGQEVKPTDVEKKEE